MRLDYSAPIIIIGGGRSGSTALVRVLASSPHVDMANEVNFLAPRLFNAIFSNRLDMQPFWQLRIAERLAAGYDPHEGVDTGEAVARLQSLVSDSDVVAARRFAGSLVAEMTARLIGVGRPTAERWGFKEIWNGTADTHEWVTYSNIFPNAQYIHLVRHPLQFAQSVCLMRGEDYNHENNLRALGWWVSLVRFNRGAAKVGSYLELTFEEMNQAPETFLQRLEQQIGLELGKPAREQLRQRSHGTKGKGPLLPVELSRIPGLSELMDEFGYCA